MGKRAITGETYKTPVKIGLMERKSLKNIDEICEVGGFSKPYFYKYLELGLPARKIFGCWRAHTKNIENFMQRLTLSAPEIQDPEAGKTTLSREKIVQKP